MRSYLSLIPISAKVHRRQNRMTLLCIIFAVFLVTAIFSMVDLMVRCETEHSKENHGFWHIAIQNLSEEGAEEIRSRGDVAAASWYDVVNMDQSRAYEVDGIQTALCGIEESFRTDIMSYFPADSSIQANDAAILTPNARELLGVDVGESITLRTPAGEYSFLITGFRIDDSRYATKNGTGEATALLVKGEQIGIFMNVSTFRQIMEDNQDSGSETFYVQFASRANIGRAISEIQAQCDVAEGDMEQNFILMGLAGLSNNTMVKSLYPLAGILFLLILAAGILMISGSLNSTVAQRTQFFGMMRCIGMSKRQVIRFVKLEALNWCKTAIPIGAALGVVISWVLGAILRYWVQGEFSDWPVFGVSLVGIVSGVVLGLLTVLLASRSPAKRASRVSPVAAVSGNLEDKTHKQHRTETRFGKIESALGISHAVSAKKNLVLMSGSFALSIILFLAFSVLVELLGCLLPTAHSAPNLTIASQDYSNTIPYALAEEIREMPGVRHAFGRMYREDIPASFPVETAETTVDLISYDELQLGWLLEDDLLRKGSDLERVYGNSDAVLCIWDQDVPLTIGDTVTVGDSQVEIAGMLTHSPFSNSGQTNGEIILICSEETFTRLTGVEGYAILDVQVTKSATDEEVASIEELAADQYSFTDRRDEGDRSTFWAFSLFIYGFLAIIALITVLNIVNSISMSVSARIKQYGAMRAVGMGGRQLTRMIAAEAATYAFTGCIVGCAAGLPLSRLLYNRLITTNFPYYTWSIPVPALLIILLFVIGATITSVHAPAKRIRGMSITDTINEL